tara:strand:- start:33478 stop:34047 length:570 start_codon:yes stop_codon:yes gene_type:complete
MSKDDGSQHGLDQNTVVPMTSVEDERDRKLYRRLLLQRRLARAAHAQTYRQAAGPLRTAGIRFSRLSPAAVSEALGPLSSLPGRDERIDWSLVERANCLTWSDANDRDAMFRTALEACAAASERVAVIWHTHMSGMRITAADLADHAPMILDLGSEIWVCRADNSPWLIECSRWDREICYGQFLPDGIE